MTTAVDPLEQMLATEAQNDHAKAAQRGARCLRIAERVITELHAIGQLRNQDDTRVAVFHAVANEFYPNVAIDVPELRRHS